MLLPKNERREVKQFAKKKLWIYGCPFSGKSTLADQFPDPLFLSTDGNVNNITAAFLPIKNTVTTKGRLTETTLAWATLKDALLELEKKDNDFKTIVIDLVEDTYEHCRVYCYDKLGIEHESDNSFKAWDFVRNEFLGTMKRFMNLDYENIILISHEDTSKDITKRGGDKITAVRPNITEKISLKLAGMVDIVARIVVEDGKRSISFKSDNVVFGGGRLKLNATEIPLNYNELMNVYENSTEVVTNKREEIQKVVPDNVEPEQKVVPENVEETVETVEETTEQIVEYVEEVVETVEEPVADDVEPEVVEEKPRRRRRINLDQ